MNDWMYQSARQWDSLRAHARSQRWPSQPGFTVASCAATTGREWYQTRAADTVSSFLAMDGITLVRYPTFGRVKIQNLIEILSAAMGVEPDSDHLLMAFDQADNTGSAKNPETALSKLLPEIRTSTECLQQMGVPAELPLELVRLPVRIQHYCEENHLKLLGEFLEAWETLGEPYFMNLPNLGKKSVGLVRGFYQALQRGDTAIVGTWIPFAVNSSGLSLAKGLTAATLELPERHRALLEKRLVHGQTLEEAAADFALTRERTRQVEARLLNRVEKLLEWFPQEQEAMLAGWMQGKSPLIVLGDAVPETERELISAALGRYCKDRPEGAARDLAAEVRLEQWHEQLKHHPDLLIEGVDMEEFLLAEVPEEFREELCLSLDGYGRIQLDHQKGRVVHTGPRLRDVVKAILAKEDDPIPLTWLLELVKQTPTHGYVEREQIYRYRSQWKSDDPDFPRDKVLWHQ
ncbi:MAG: hypothetical protein NTV80_21100 [Verrucomicrobia bacterium]|nr:hypothetical protein [Verrucomicrobiota bacterium]